ncbi:MAG: TCP-1/cpn60 chaperonin family protein, partial [Infirmifilum sp.]
LTRVEDISPEALGTARLVEERKVADEKMVFVEGCPNPKSVTILVRGGAEHIVDEAERAIHDALSVVRNVIEEPKIVAGGGAVEIELAMRLREFAKTLPSKEQLAVEKYAEALENLVAILAQNSGVEPIDILAELKRLHAKGEKWAGINAYTGKVENMYQAGILEPAVVKKQVLKSATEAAMMILRIDDIIAAQPPKGKEKEKEKGPSGEFGAE